MADFTTQLYRVKLLDSRQQDRLPYSQVVQLIRNGVIDLDDSISPAGTEEWFYAWELEDAFEPIVLDAYRSHIKAITRMRRSIASEWLTIVEFRDQRDGLLLSAPGVKESAWASRARPDLVNEVAGHELFAAAAQGAALQAAAANYAANPASRQVARERVSSRRVFSGNVSKILHGDWPDWADPKALLKTAKANGFKIFFVAFMITVFTDPLRPWMHLQWFVIGSGLCAIYTALRQLASPGTRRFWADRFVNYILFILFFSIFLVVTTKTESKVRAGVLSRIPQVASLQEAIQKEIDRRMN